MKCNYAKSHLFILLLSYTKGIKLHIDELHKIDFGYSSTIFPLAQIPTSKDFHKLAMK